MSKQWMTAGVLALWVVASWAADGKGMTWASQGHRSNLGIHMVGCQSRISGDCDAYEGDTSCAEARPILCVNVDNSPRPNYPIPGAGGVMAKEFYRGWLGGHMATTQPVVGATMTNPKNGDGPGNPDTTCREAFGDGWRMAEFHDGKYVEGMKRDQYYGNGAWHSPSPWPKRRIELRDGGWSFAGYGHVREDTRFWVRNIGQPANCWDR